MDVGGVLDRILKAMGHEHPIFSMERDAPLSRPSQHL